MKKIQYIQPETQVFKTVAPSLMQGTITENTSTASTINNGELDAHEGNGDWEDSPWEE